MKECPKCNEYVGDNAEVCFNCRYSFVLNRVISNEERKAIVQEREDRIKITQQTEAEKQRLMEEEQRLLEEKRRLFELEKQKFKEDIEKYRLENVPKNPMYEYTTDIIYDKFSGSVNQQALDLSLQRHSLDNWRLHSIYVNEIGKNAAAFDVGGVGVGINATMDATVLVFERCIRPGAL